MTGAVAGEVEASFWLVGFSTYLPQPRDCEAGD